MSKQEAVIDGDKLRFDHPVFDGVEVEVQHPIDKGEFSTVFGMVGICVITIPTGQPRVVLNVTHHDKTSLVAMFHQAEELAEFMIILTEAHAKAVEIAATARKAARQ